MENLWTMIRSIAVLIILNIVLSCHGQNDKISLAGKWSLCLDSVKNPHNIDLKSLNYNLAISLPSTLDSAGISTADIVQPDLVREVMLHLQRIVLEDSTQIAQILEGNTSKLGSFSFPLASLPAPAKYTIELSLQGTTYKNQWNIWLYKKEVESQDNGILVTSSFKDAVEALNEVKKVLLNPNIKYISGITGKFVSVFWSPVHFPDQPGTMGLLMNPKHAAFRDFPTDFYSNWQWWDLCKNSKTVILDNLTVDPIVTVIDNFFKNRKLGNIFEAKVGKDLLVFSSVDSHTDHQNRLVSRQLEQQLNYMNNTDFNPG